MTNEMSIPDAPSTPPPPVPVMEYNTPRADLVPRRKYVGMLVIATIFGAILLGLAFYRLAARPTRLVAVARTTPAVVISPPAPTVSQADLANQIAQSRKRANEAQLNELLTKTLPSTQVVYEEDPVGVRRLHGKGVCNQQASRRDIAQPFFNAFEPPVYRTDGFWESGHRDHRDALLFAHQLTSPGGNRRLVMLEMEVRLEGTKLADDEYKVELNRQLKYRICEPRIAGGSPNTVRHGVSLKIVQDGERDVIPIKWVDGTLRSARPAEYNLRFFAGQPDPQDASHFTVDYEIFGVKNTVDGWLTDDDFLRIVPRGGKVDRANWQIEAVSTPRR